MAIIVNTNMTALKTQKNLTTATNGMNKALNRMSTGFKINSAKDDAAGLYVATGLDTQIRGSKVAKDNVATGTNVLQTIEGDLDNMLTNIQRIRDLAVQAANSIYGTAEIQAMKDEVQQRIDEVKRICEASNFNGLKLLDATDTNLTASGLRLQVGANADSDGNRIVIDKEIFEERTDCSTLGSGVKETDLNNTAYKNLSIEEAFKSTADGGKDIMATATGAADFIAIIDNAIDTISTRKATLGAVMNRLESAEACLTTTIENNTAAKSTIMDADVAEESANFTKYQILQQTSASLLVQANALPQIAISLVQG